jgi:hypothetical protein
MPALAKRAAAAAAQMDLFADAPTRIARAIKEANLDGMAPLAALDFLRKLKSEL